MTDLQQRKFGVWSIAAGTVTLGIAAAESQLEKVRPSFLPSSWATVFVLLGILMIVGGALLWLLSRAPAIISWRDYECQRARKKDLPLIYDFARQHFGDDVSPPEVMRRWHSRNPSVFFVIVREKRKSFEVRRRMVGYFCAIPVLESAKAKIESGEIKGRDIPNEYIASARKDCSALYIGGLAGKGAGAKGALLAVMNREFVDSDNKWATTIYTRPITKDGIRIAIQKGFIAIDPSHHGELGVIYKLELG